jgi:hypothetical protein
MDIKTHMKFNKETFDKITTWLLTSNIAAFLFFTLLVLVYYHKSFYTFFQGDEWFVFSVFLPDSKSWFGVLKSIYHTFTKNYLFGSSHITPISFFLWVVSMKLFGLNHFYYILSSLVIHIVNTYLLFLFTTKLTKIRTIGFIAAIFFATTSNTYEAVNWVMNYLLTSLSVTFFLLAGLLLLELINNKKASIKKIAIFSLLCIMSVLTKESTVMLFPIFLLIIILFKPSDKKFFSYISTLRVLYGLILAACIYAPMRYIIPKVFPAPATTQLDLHTIFTVPLTTFRIFAYPIRMLTEIFVPQKYIINLVELITVLAYPTYGYEQPIRGTSFLLFTQSAGIDIIVLPIGIFLSCLVFYFIFLSNIPLRMKKIVFLAISIVVLASLPLLFVAVYSPGAAYVTLFDSRHMYFPSIGGALLFALAVYGIGYQLIRIGHKKVFLFSGIAVIMLVWMIIDYSYMQRNLKLYVELGTDRKILFNKIAKTVPDRPKKSIMYIRSNSSYYGYGDLMPPYETNFGEVLTVFFNQKNQLPNEFLDTTYLKSKGLNGQGYKEIGDNGFGYFLSFPKMMKAIQANHLGPDNVIAFQWDGKNHLSDNITGAIQSDIRDNLKASEKYKDWQKIVLDDLNFSFLIPPTATTSSQLDNEDKTIIKNITITDGNRTTQILVHNKIFNIGIFEDISMMRNADGEMIDKNFYLRDIPMHSGTPATVKLPSQGSQMQYYLPTIIPQKIIEIINPNESAAPGKVDPYIEELISLFSYPEKD